MPDTSSTNTQRRFGGLERLHGPLSLTRLAGAHVAVAGIGGVGSWCVEALARSGVGMLTLIDLDHISESNINRQLHALTPTLGQSKVVAMAERVHGINPDCRVHGRDEFVSADTVDGIFAADLDVLVDCTDQVGAKIAMVLQARARRVPVIVCGGAGGKTNPTSLRATDLALAANDALLAKLRTRLRRGHAYPKASDHAGKPRKRPPKMGVRSLWFDQPVQLPLAWQPGDALVETGALQGLSCAGYGSVVTVTATMGMVAAHEALHWLLNGRFPSP